MLVWLFFLFIFILPFTHGKPHSPIHCCSSPTILTLRCPHITNRTLIVIFQLLLLRYMVWQYVYRIWERSADEERIKREAERVAADEEKARLKEEESKKGHIISRVGGAVLGGVVDGAGLAFKAGKGVLSVIPGVGGKPMDPDERAHLNGVVRGLANTSLAAIGMNESLGYYQQMLGNAADGVQITYELFQWKNPATTRAVFIGLLCTTMYSLFFPHVYLWLAGKYL
jgi:hypothetical protein